MREIYTGSIGSGSQASTVLGAIHKRRLQKIALFYNPPVRICPHLTTPSPFPLQMSKMNNN